MKNIKLNFVLWIVSIVTSINGITVSPIEHHRIPRLYKEVTTNGPLFYYSPSDLNAASNNFVPQSRTSLHKIRRVQTEAPAMGPRRQLARLPQSQNFDRSSNRPFQLNLQEQNYLQQQQYMRQNFQPTFNYNKLTTPMSNGYRTNLDITLTTAKPPKFNIVRQEIGKLKDNQKNLFTSKEDERPASRSELKTPSPGEDIFYKVENLFDGHIKSKQNSDNKYKKIEPQNFSYKEIPKMLTQARAPQYFSNKNVNNKKVEATANIPEFVPIQRYAQVRKTESLASAPRPENEPRARERIKSEKSHTLYSEQGYEDKEYDHGDEDRFGVINEHHNRRRRSVLESKFSSNDNSDEEVFEEIEELPISLALIKKQTKLKGDELLRYISELLKNSSKYLPDEDDSFETQENDYFMLNRDQVKDLLRAKNYLTNSVVDSVTSASTSSLPTYTKYPYYNLPSHILNEMSALRYAENIKRLPEHSNLPYYDTKQKILCEENDPIISPTPKGVGSRTPIQGPSSNQQLGELGNRIVCMKNKYFGQHPLDNPIFKEQFVTSPINYKNPFPYKKTTDEPWTSASTRYQDTILNSYINPSINVYDDVVSNIRASLSRDKAQRKKQIQYEISKWKFIPSSEFALSEDPALRDPEKDINTSASELDVQEETYFAILKKKKGNIESNLDSKELEDVPYENVFDVNQYLPKLFMVKPDGKIYRVKYTTKKRSIGKNDTFSNKYLNKNDQTQDGTKFKKNLRRPHLRPPRPVKRVKVHYDRIKLIG